MANVFVWSGAGGGNDGSSWGDAYTTLMKDWGAEAGFDPSTDIVYVRSVHAESTAGALTVNGSTAEGATAPVRIYCVVGNTTGTTPGALATGASVTVDAVADLNIIEGLYIYGVTFISGNDITIASTPDSDVTLEECSFTLASEAGSDRINLGGTSGAQAANIHFINPTFTFTNATQYFFRKFGKIKWEGGSLAGTELNLFFLYASYQDGSPFSCIGADISKVTGSLCKPSSDRTAGELQFKRCLMAEGWTLCQDAIDLPGYRIETFHCQVGTDSDPAYQMWISDVHGDIKADVSRYRTGGASDGERTNPISWDFDTTAGSKRSYPGHALFSPPITAWTDGDASTEHTYRIYFASDATINDDELWMSLEGPNDAATNSMAVFTRNRVAPLTAASAHSTDTTSTWTGDGVTTKQYMEVAYTPDKPGPVTVVIYMAKASDNIYVDPQIVIDP